MTSHPNVSDGTSCVRPLRRQIGRGLWREKVLQSVFLYPTPLSPVIRFQNAARSVLLKP